MTSAENNPFVFPGFGQTGEMGRNPVLAGMEMMRQAWQGMAGAGADAGAMAPPMNLGELDKRIADLRVVENWLRMNTSMLTSAIQALEVQRATLNTLKSYADFTAAAGKSESGGAADPANPGEAAMAWWNLMQQQFEKLAAASMAPTSSPQPENGPAPQKKAARKSAAARGRASAAKKSDS